MRSRFDHRAGRARAALFLGLLVVMGLAERLYEHEIAPFSWFGLLISAPILTATALFVSFLLHAGRS
jgi:hypothetical protein